MHKKSVENKSRHSFIKLRHSYHCSNLPLYLFTFVLIQLQMIYSPISFSILLINFFIFKCINLNIYFCIEPFLYWISFSLTYCIRLECIFSLRIVCLSDALFCW